MRDWFRPADGGASNLSQPSGEAAYRQEGSTYRQEAGAHSQEARAYGSRSGSSVLQNAGAVSAIRSADRSSPFTSQRPRQTSQQEFTSDRDWGVGRGYGQINGVGEAAIEGLLDVSIDETEMLDFLASDLDPIPADPAFREQLKEELWEMIVAEGWTRPKDS